jgi:hypothetical protein
MYPGLLDLTARELDVLQMSKVAFPERRKVTVELSQALMRTRVKHGQTATVTPKCGGTWRIAAALHMASRP